MHIGIWWGSQKYRPLGRLKRRWEGNFKMDFKEIVGWNELISLRVGTSGGLF
jgi:hypothetical protein